MEKVEVYGWESVISPLIAALNRLAAAHERIAAAEERIAQNARVHAEASCVIAAKMKAAHEDAKKRAV